MINVLEKNNQNISVIDLKSKLLENRIVLITEEITPELATEIQSILLYLSTSKDPISIYINSPGGDVYSGLGIYDMIKLLQNKGIIIKTVNIGICASMASIILMSGSKGYRSSLLNSTIMLHTASTYTHGKVNDVEVDIKELRRIQDVLDNIIKTNCNADLVDKCKHHDLFLSSEEAKQFNIIDSLHEN